MLTKKLLDALKKLDGILGRVEAVFFFILDQPLIGLAGLIQGIAHDLGVFERGPEIVLAVHNKQRQVQFIRSARRALRLTLLRVAG